MSAQKRNKSKWLKNILLFGKEMNKIAQEVMVKEDTKNRFDNGSFDFL